MLVCMNPLQEGGTTPRTVRVPDALWAKLTEWARHSGVGDSDALRTLLALGLDRGPMVVRREPLTWMTEHGHGVAFARVPSGPDWWDLDDLVGQVPGAVRYGRKNRNRSESWWVVPRDQAESLARLFDGRPDRIHLHYAG